MEKLVKWKTRLTEKMVKWKNRWLNRKMKKKLVKQKNWLNGKLG